MRGRALLSELQLQRAWSEDDLFTAMLSPGSVVTWDGATPKSGQKTASSNEVTLNSRCCWAYEVF